MKKLSGPARSKRSKALLILGLFVSGTLAISLSTLDVQAFSVSDDFNRANGALGGNWTTVSGTNAPQISGNQMNPSTPSSLNSAYWSANSFSDDQFAQATFPTPFVTAKYGPGIAVRMANSRGYFLWYGNSDNKVSIWRMDSTSPSDWHELADSGALTVSNSDTWRIEAVGSNIAGYQNGNLVVQTTDTTYTSGNPGVWLYYDNNQIDNWSGGDVTPGYTVGGTVSGLTSAEAVVLQNNGTDDLSVSNNGAFTIRTGLVTGSNYNITVRTNPAYQTCTVTNGSGTVASSNITNISVSCSGSPPAVIASDDFNRSDGGLGTGWTPINDGGMAISSQTVAGTNNTGGYSGDIRSGETYPSNQYSQIEVSSTPLSSGQWIGPTVRAQNGGQDLYLGLYFNNSGTYILQIYKRTSGVWGALGSPYNCGTLAAGTKLKLMAVGSSIAFMEDNVERAAVYDNTIKGGWPGIVAYSTPKADNWSAGNAGFEAHYLSTDGNGVETYDMISDKNGFGPQILRVLRPTSPTPGVPHNFIYALPAYPGTTSIYGDGMETLRGLNAANQYNLTIIVPSFAIDPWYADNPTNQEVQQESFMTSELQPWVKQNLSTSGYEQHWLMGFSKSGIGTTDLLLKHPDLFTLGASWDFPADISSYNQFGGSSSNVYGTNANFQANYQLTNAFLQAHKAPFQANNRIWIGGYNAFQTDISDYDGVLTGLGIPHTTETPTPVAHSWDSGWVPQALAAMHTDSNNLPDATAPTVQSFAINSTSNSLTVPITTFTASDDTAVTGYKVTESPTPPLASDSGWSGTAPSSYTVSTTGNLTLFAWAKDAAGNVSPSANGSVTITPTLTVGGTISGLAGSVVLKNTINSDVKSIPSNGSYAFGSMLATGQTYNITVQTQPANQTCTIANGSGTVAGSNITNVNVTCVTPPAPPSTPSSPSGGSSPTASTTKSTSKTKKVDVTAASATTDTNTTKPNASSSASTTTVSTKTDSNSDNSSATPPATPPKQKSVSALLVGTGISAVALVTVTGSGIAWFVKSRNGV